MRIVVLDSFAADQGSLSWEGLSALGDVEMHARTDAAELLPRAEHADALLSNKVPLDAAIIERLPRLRYIGIVATGTNGVDLVACRRRGVVVTNVPLYSTLSVAQLVFALALHLTHDVAGHNERVKAGGWANSPDFMFCLGPLVELAQKTLAVVGFGAIGRAVADIATALGMHVLAARVPGSTSTDRVPLFEALGQSDIVTLHCPLTSATRGLVGADFLSAMKPGALLINTARGPLIDESALRSALLSGRLGGAALDVLDQEPPEQNHPLLDPSAPYADRVVVTPHIGWATLEARRRLISTVVQNLAAFVAGERKNRVELEP